MKNISLSLRKDFAGIGKEDSKYEWKSHDYLNMNVPIEGLAWPSTDEEKELMKERIKEEFKTRDFGHDKNFDSDPIYDSMSVSGKLEDDKKSHDYLDRSKHISEFGRPRTREEHMLFRYRHYIDYALPSSGADIYDDD